MEREGGAEREQLLSISWRFLSARWSDREHVQLAEFAAVYTYI